MTEMTDLEKVIYDIERCICHVPDACRDCSHDWSKKDGDVTAIDCMEELMTDALELLKVQEAKIERLEHDLSVAENNLNYFVNGND